jgi:TFIIF-interacting CTD phosphatase-like protein
MKMLLLDIDYTLMDTGTPRPYLKEFMEYVLNRYQVRFYTAGTSLKVAEMCRILFHQVGLSKETVIDIQRNSLHYDNCRMVEHMTSRSSSIEIKCLKKAADKLGVPVADIILFDDNPVSGHPQHAQIIQAEGWMKHNENDDYLKRVINEGIL